MSKHVDYYRGYKIEVDEIPNLRTAHLTATGPLVFPSLAANNYKLKIRSDGTVYSAPDTGGGSGSGDMLAATYDAAGIEEQLVGLTANQTLTNKTLTAPTISSPTGIVKGDVGLGNVDNTSDANKPVSTAQQAALDLKADLTTATNIVYVAQHGDAGNDGLDPSTPLDTIDAAITVASTTLSATAANPVTVYVMDGGRYTENITTAAGINILAEGATLIGTLEITTDSTIVLNEHYSNTNNSVMLIKSGGSGHGYYTAKKMDGRGTAGTNTGTTLVRNNSNGSILFTHIGVIFVPQDGEGIADNGIGFGHIHFWSPDIYLAGNNAIGISTVSAQTDFIGFVDHILETGSPSGTKAISITNANAEVKITVNEIVADTVYDVVTPNAGKGLYLNCIDTTGTKTGTPAYDILVEIENRVGLTGNETIAGVKTFSSFPVTPSLAPSTDYQVANKKYVDDSITGGGLGDMLQSVYDQASISEQLVGLTATQTLTNKTLTSPVVNSPTGIVKGDVGLGNVENYGIALQAEAQAGTSNLKYMTPLRVAEAITALGNSGDMAASTYDAANVSEQLVGLTATQTLTNKTLTAPAISNPTGLDSTDVGLGNVANTAQIPLSTGTTKGDIVGYTASATVSRLAVGSDGQVLTAASGEATGLQWTSLTSSSVGLGNVTNTAQIPLSTGTTKGDILAYTASATISRLGVGTDGQVLTAASAQSTGLQWTTLSAPAVSFSTVTSLTIDMTSKEYVRVNLSAGGTLSLSNVTTGKQYYFLFQDTGASGYTVTLPNTADIAAATTFDVPAGEYKEVAMIYDGTNRIWQISEDLVAL